VPGADLPSFTVGGDSGGEGDDANEGKGDTSAGGGDEDGGGGEAASLLQLMMHKDNAASFSLDTNIFEATMFISRVEERLIVLGYEGRPPRLLDAR
jgi:hypothetical protein